MSRWYRYSAEAISTAPTRRYGRTFGASTVAQMDSYAMRRRLFAKHFHAWVRPGVGAGLAWSVEQRVRAGKTVRRSSGVTLLMAVRSLGVGVGPSRPAIRRMTASRGPVNEAGG